MLCIVEEQGMRRGGEEYRQGEREGRKEGDPEIQRIDMRGPELHLPAYSVPAALKPTAQFYSLSRLNKKVAIY